MKIVVIGDIVVPCDLLVEAAKKLDQDAEVVAVEWNLRHVRNSSIKHRT